MVTFNPATKHVTIGLVCRFAVGSDGEKQSYSLTGASYKQIKACVTPRSDSAMFISLPPPYESPKQEAGEATEL